MWEFIKTYTPESGLTIKLGSTTQSTTANNPPLPPNVHFDGTIGAPPFGQDPLFGKINAKGNDVTTLISRVLENMDTGDTTTNKGFLNAILKESYKSWTVQELGRQFQNIAFINESNKTDLTQDIRSAMKALALTHANGLSVLRPGAKNAPAPHIPELHTPLFSREPLKHHFGSIFETIQNDFPNMPIIEQRKMASKEYCRQVKERYSKTSTHVGYIDTRRRDTAQSLRQNNFPQELFEPTQAYHDRQPYVSIETTMGGNDQSKRGGELKSENTQFGNQRSQTHVEAGLCRGEIQVKLGDKAATPEERRAYIKDKSKNNGPMLVEIFSPWHSVDDWANEATLWAEAGQSLVIYAPEHAEEMNAKDLWENFYKPCLERAEKDGFSDQIAFLGLKDTSSATSMPRAKNELSQLPILAEQDGYELYPWAHHTHDIGQGVAISATLADNGFRIFWTSPDNAAGSGANVPECALYNVLKGNGFSPDFDPELAQEMSPVDAYATLLGEPYKANHGQTSTTIIDSYMAPGAIAHTWKALATEFPRATEKEMIDIKKDFIKAHKTLFKLILLVAPLTPNPNKISNMSKDLVKITKEKGIRISEITPDYFVTICKDNLSQLPELIKYLGGSHYPKWAQYSKVEEKYPDLVEKSKELYAELKLSNEDDLWENKLKKTEETLLELNHHFTESTLTDMSYHGTNLASTLALHKLTPNSMYMIRESDLQRLSQPGSVQNRTATLLTPNGTIPVTFLGRTTKGSTIEYLVQTYGDSGPISKISIPGKKESIAGVSSQTFGLQSNGHFINEGKKGEIVEWYLPKGLVFPGENLGLINEDKNISPITARELSEFAPLVPSTKDSGKTTILESGTKTLELSSISSLTKETKQALLAIHDLRNCEETSALALKALSIDALKEATSHYPVRHASSKSKEATLSFIDHNINDHEAYNSIRDMFKAQLKPE